MARTLGLTERQRRFVGEYRGDGDGVRAARAAGFGGDSRSLAAIASRLLKHEGVRDALRAKAKEQTSARVKAAGGKGAKPGTQAWGLQRLVDIADRAKRDGNLFAERLAVNDVLKLTGELGRDRLEPPEDKPQPPAGHTPKEVPTIRAPARLLVVKERA